MEVVAMSEQSLLGNQESILESQIAVKTRKNQESDEQCWPGRVRQPQDESQNSKMKLANLRTNRVKLLYSFIV